MKGVSITPSFSDLIDIRSNLLPKSLHLNEMTRHFFIQVGSQDSTCFFLKFKLLLQQKGFKLYPWKVFQLHHHFLIWLILDPNFCPNLFIKLNEMTRHFFIQVGSQDSNKMSWLPTKLPPHCKIIVSCTKEDNNPALSQGDHDNLMMMLVKCYEKTIVTSQSCS